VELHLVQPFQWQNNEGIALNHNPKYKRMKILWTKNQGSILLCEKNLIWNVQVLLPKKNDKRKTHFTFTWRVKMGSNVTICKFGMHLSWHTLRSWGYVYYNCLLFNYIWHLSCLPCTFPLRNYPKTKLQILFLKKLKTLKGKKIIKLFF